jgi:hypothetical protein
MNAVNAIKCIGEKWTKKKDIYMLKLFLFAKLN